MRFLRRSLVGLFLATLTAGLLAVAGKVGWTALETRMNREPQGRPAEERVFAVNVATVEPRRIAPVLTVYGEIRARRTLEIRATASGRVVWLADAFEEGGQVQEGEMLVRIDPAVPQNAVKVAETQLSQAEVELADAQRGIVLARDDLAAVEAQSRLRDQALARQRDARARGVGTDALVEESELAAAAGRAQVVSKRQAIAQAQNRLEVARTELDRQRLALSEAQRALTDTEIRADFSGTLTGVTLVAGRLVANNESLGQLIDPEALEVAFRLSSAEYARLLDADGHLKPARVQVVLDAGGVDLTASGVIVREAASVGAGQTGRQVFASLDTPRGLRPGDFVSVRIEESPLDAVVMLPATALAADGTVLAVTPDERLERLQAEMVRRQGDSVIVNAATLAGRDIVAEQTPLLGPGIKVRVIRPQGPADADAVAEAPEMVELTEERRARLIAFVEANTRMPEDARKRVLTQLAAPQVPAAVVARLESRMGG